MSASERRCPKCSGEMVQGFIVDFDAGGCVVSSWFKGAPKAFWAGMNLSGVSIQKCIPVGTYRCSGCGFLESYAQPEFAAK